MSSPAGTTRWSDFTALAPELAAFGAERLAAPPAYLATIRSDGTPRVHPVTPIIGGGGLFLFMEPTSPKGRDLTQRRWYAMHNGVPDIHGSGGEFLVWGEARLVADLPTRELVVAASSYQPDDRYIVFELLVGAARCNGYGDVALPAQKHWNASPS